MRGNRDFVAFVEIVVCVETVISLFSLETWLRQAGPNRYCAFGSARRRALRSCRPRAFPLRHSPLTLPVTRLQRPVFAAQVAACLQIWTAAPTPSRLLLPQAALGLRGPARAGGYKDLKKWPYRIPIKQDTAGPFWRAYSALHYRPRACGAQRS